MIAAARAAGLLLRPWLNAIKDSGDSVADAVGARIVLGTLGFRQRVEGDLVFLLDL